MYKVAIRNNWLSRNMTNRELGEYVEITRDDIFNLLNNSTIDDIESLHTQHFTIKGLRFIKEGNNLYVADTYYGSKKIYFEMEDNEVTNFKYLDIWVDIQNNYSQLHESDSFLYNETIFELDTINTMANNGDTIQIDKLYKSIDNGSIYRLFNISTGYINTNLSVELNSINGETISISMNLNQDIENNQYLREYASPTRNNEIFTHSDYASLYRNGRLMSASGSMVWTESEHIDMDLPESNTFSYTKKDKEIREFIDGPGLFQIGVKKFATLPILEQAIKINELSYVKSDFEIDDKILIDLSGYGKYHVYILKNPIAKRQDTKLEYANPFIGIDSNQICLGTAKTMYDNCWNNNNYLECLKIIKEVLICDDDSEGYRTWKECK